VVVESPTKARTISAILGPRYQVMASKGHVADLPEKGLGYDETTFEPVYVVPPRKAKDLAALKDAAKRAKPVLLEPVMAVEVVTPQEFLGDVIGDLSRRRGRVEGQEPRGNALAVKASVPLAEMFGYATDLRSNTQGRANYTMQFDRYEEVPNNLAEGIVEHRTGEPVGANA